MSRTVKVGVIGLGMGRHHLAAYTTHPHAEVTALCDTDPAHLQDLAKEYGIKGTFTDAGTMMREADLDAVSIAVPNVLHAPLATAALERGLHVLCEKPMAMTVAEAESMKTAAERAGKNLMINFSSRFSPASQALKRQVDAGVLGDIYMGRTVWHRRRGIPRFGGWFGTRALSGGGPLIDLGVHRLDLALWLMGYPEPVSVSGSTYDRIARPLADAEGKTFDVEDAACGFIRFANGASLILEASWALHVGKKELITTQLYGTRGGLFQCNQNEGYRLGAELYTEEDGTFFTKRLDHTDTPCPSSYHEFIDSVVENRPPAATADEGLKVMKILEGIYASAATGREMRFDKKMNIG